MQPTQNEQTSTSYSENKIHERFPVKKVQLQLPTGSGPIIGSIFIGSFCFLFAVVALAFAYLAGSQMDPTDFLAIPTALITFGESTIGSMPFVLIGTLFATIGITLVIAK